MNVGRVCSLSGFFILESHDHFFERAKVGVCPRRMQDSPPLRNLRRERAKPGVSESISRSDFMSWITVAFIVVVMIVSGCGSGESAISTSNGGSGDIGRFLIVVVDNINADGPSLAVGIFQV